MADLDAQMSSLQLLHADYSENEADFRSQGTPAAPPTAQMLTMEELTRQQHSLGSKVRELLQGLGDSCSIVMPKEKFLLQQLLDIWNIRFESITHGCYGQCLETPNMLPNIEQTKRKWTKAKQEWRLQLGLPCQQRIRKPRNNNLRAQGTKCRRVHAEDGMAELSHGPLLSDQLLVHGLPDLKEDLHGVADPAPMACLTPGLWDSDAERAEEHYAYNQQAQLDLQMRGLHLQWRHNHAVVAEPSVPQYQPFADVGPRDASNQWWNHLRSSLPEHAPPANFITAHLKC